MEAKIVKIDNEEYIYVDNGEDFLPYEVMVELCELGLVEEFPMPYEEFKKLKDEAEVINI